MSSIEIATPWEVEPTTETERIARQHLEHSIGCGGRSDVKLINSSSDNLLYVTLSLQFSTGWLDEETTRLRELGALENNWDTYGSPAPNGRALGTAAKALQQLHSLKVRPDRLAPSTEGGVVISFFEGQRYADIEFFNSGEIAAIVSDTNDRDVWEATVIEIDVSLRRIIKYIGRRNYLTNATQSFFTPSNLLRKRGTLLPLRESSSSSQRKPGAGLDSMSKYLSE